MKAFINDKETNLYIQEAALVTGVESKFVSEYCKKLTLQNFLKNKLMKIYIFLRFNILLK